MNSTEIYIAIAVMTFVNYFTRIFPFLFFSKKELPPVLSYVEKYFPAVIMSILVLYTLKDIDFINELFAIKELSSILFVFMLHVVFKNYLVSIFLGTIFYMALVQYF